MRLIRWLLYLKEFARLHRKEPANRMQGEPPRLDPKKVYYDPKQFRR